MDEFLDEIEEFLGEVELRECTKDLISTLPYIAKITMEVYLTFLDEGFTKDQSFMFAIKFFEIIMKGGN